MISEFTGFGSGQNNFSHCAHSVEISSTTHFVVLFTEQQTDDTFVKDKNLCWPRYQPPRYAQPCIFPLLEGGGEEIGEVVLFSLDRKPWSRQGGESGGEQCSKITLLHRCGKVATLPHCSPLVMDLPA